MERPSRPTTSDLQSVFYSDFTNGFSFHPITGNLTRLTNERSVKQALTNLLLTNTMERIYQPLMGPDVYRILFETIIDNTDKFLIREKIVSNIERYEPRVELLNVELLTEEDIGNVVNSATGALLTEQDFRSGSGNSLIVNIVFRIINTNEQLSLNVLLERNR